MSENRDFKREFLRYKNGWIPVAFLIRNCHYVGELSNEDEAVLFDALKKDTTGFLKLREYPPQLCRPKRPNDSKDVISRSIYCKGFPINIIKSKDRQQLDPFFNQFPTVVKLKVNIIFLALKYQHGSNINQSFFQVRNPNQGSLIAQFQTRHQAEKFLNQETVKFDDCFIDRQWM